MVKENKSSGLCQRLLIWTKKNRVSLYYLWVPLISRGTGNIFCNLPRMPLSPGPHPISLPHGFLQKHMIKMYPTHSAEYSGEQGTDKEKVSMPKRAYKVAVIKSSQTRTQKKTKFLYCPFLHSCQLLYFELTAFTRHHFHCTHTHIDKTCRPEPQRGRRSKHKGKNIFIYLSVSSLHLPL